MKLTKKSVEWALANYQRQLGHAPVTKAAPEKRYTLAPMYIPNWLDAHKEFVEPEHLQEAVWNYVRKDNRNVYIQHSNRIAGEWVEMLTWPYPVTVPLLSPTTLEKSKEVTLPAHTVFMGVIWQPWAWEKVKRGELLGYSMGGVARRVEAEFAGEG